MLPVKEHNSCMYKHPRLGMIQGTFLNLFTITVLSSVLCFSDGVFAADQVGHSNSFLPEPDGSEKKQDPAAEFRENSIQWNLDKKSELSKGEQNAETQKAQEQIDLNLAALGVKENTSERDAALANALIDNKKESVKQVSSADERKSIDEADKIKKQQEDALKKSNDSPFSFGSVAVTNGGTSGGASSVDLAYQFYSTRARERAKQNGSTDDSSSDSGQQAESSAGVVDFDHSNAGINSARTKVTGASSRGRSGSIADSIANSSSFPIDANISSQFTQAATNRLVDNSLDILSLSSGAGSFYGSPIYSDLPLSSKNYAKGIVSEILRNDLNGNDSSSNVDPLYNLITAEGFQDSAAAALGADTLNELNLSVLAAQVVNSSEANTQSYITALAAVQNETGLKLSDLFPPTYSYDGGIKVSGNLSDCAKRWVEGASEINSGKYPKQAIANVNSKKAKRGFQTLSVLLHELKKFKALDLLCQVQVPMEKKSFPDKTTLLLGFKQQLGAALSEVKTKIAVLNRKSMANEITASESGELKPLNETKIFFEKALADLNSKKTDKEIFATMYGVYKDDKARFFWRKYHKTSYILSRRMTALTVFRRFFWGFTQPAKANNLPLFYLVKKSLKLYEYKVAQEHLVKKKAIAAKKARILKDIRDLTASRK